MTATHRRIRSFVLRQGRLTRAQQSALDSQWRVFGIEHSTEPLSLQTVFGNTNPVTLEIGFGNGDSLLEQAIVHPQKNYIGIEVHRPGVGHLLHRIVQTGISNIRVMNHDAIEVLQHQIPDASLDCVQLFFPDPWQKKRHHKRRILQQNFIDTLRVKLKQEGLFHMATDWENYAEHMQKEMAAAEGFVLISSDRGERPLTKFEQRGLRLGHAVWDGVYQKRHDEQ